MGAQAFKIIEQLSKHITDDIVEVGSDRGEGSTQFLKSFSDQNKNNFYSIDFDKDVYNNATTIINDNAYHMTGEDFLENEYVKFNSKISFAYLDNFDYIFPEIEGRDFVHDQVSSYKTKGYEMNNDNSKLAHLQQSQLIHKYSAKECFILFDDTYIEHTGEYSGKGGTAIPWLLKNGWYIMNEDKGAHKRKYERYHNYGEWKDSLKDYWFILRKMPNE